MTVYLLSNWWLIFSWLIVVIVVLVVTLVVVVVVEVIVIVVLVWLLSRRCFCCCCLCCCCLCCWFFRCCCRLCCWRCCGCCCGLFRCCRRCLSSSTFLWVLWALCRLLLRLPPQHCLCLRRCSRRRFRVLALWALGDELGDNKRVVNKMPICSLSVVFWVVEGNTLRWKKYYWYFNMSLVRAKN